MYGQVYYEIEEHQRCTVRRIVLGPHRTAGDITSDVHVWPSVEKRDR